MLGALRHPNIVWVYGGEAGGGEEGEGGRRGREKRGTSSAC
jgi:hypothetical protein